MSALSSVLCSMCEKDCKTREGRLTLTHPSPNASLHGKFGGNTPLRQPLPESGFDFSRLCTLVKLEAGTWREEPCESLNGEKAVFWEVSLQQACFWKYYQPVNSPAFRDRIIPDLNNTIVAVSFSIVIFLSLECTRRAKRGMG